ncbi:MAG: hypothetical protein M3M99_05065 [Actinomycetota bacterium]|nr:hypothetical protein [Actinomycetota bacterium]
MSRLPEGRRELRPSRQATGERRGPSFGSSLNISVPISVGLPLLVVGLFLILTGIRTDGELFLALGGVLALAGVVLLASGKRL